MLIEVILNLARLAAWINKTNKLLILFTFLSTLLDFGEKILRNPHAEECIEMYHPLQASIHDKLGVPDFSHYCLNWCVMTLCLNKRKQQL